VALLLAGLTSLLALDSPYLTGYAGVLGNLTVMPNSYSKPNKEEDSFAEQLEETFRNPALFSQGYFGGLMLFKNYLILRGEFSVDSGDILGASPFDSPRSFNSIFRIQELSSVLKLQSSSASHYLSLFYGEYEPIGSDTFLQRQFGIAPIKSDLTSSFTSLNGASINESYGGGLSYVLRPSAPIAAGIYLYKDRRDNSDRIYRSWKNDIRDNIYSKKKRQGAFNADFRVAGAFEYLTFDFRAGIALPDDSIEDSLGSGFVNMEYLSLKAGMSILAGKQTSAFNVLLQTGFSDLLLDPAHIKTPRRWKDSDDGEQEVKHSLNWNNAAENFHFLLEPRIQLRNASFSLTAFNIPCSQARKMFYLNNYNGGGLRKDDDYVNPYVRNRVNPCGIDLHACTDSLKLGDMNMTVGTHLTLSTGGQTLMELYRDSKSEQRKDLNNKHYWNKTAFITPYAKVPIHGGEAFAAVTVSSHIFEKTNNWPSSVSIKVGFNVKF
ncbi:MAG: hypothetical protein IJU95_10975, partial [Treponema sp.]|nr:hypothetical protein [Treponema sp.]